MKQGNNGEEKGFVYRVAESGGTILYTFVLAHPNKTVRTMETRMNVLARLLFDKKKKKQKLRQRDNTRIKTAVICAQQGSLGNNTDANPSLHPATPARHKLFRV